MAKNVRVSSKIAPAELAKHENHNVAASSDKQHAGKQTNWRRLMSSSSSSVESQQHEERMAANTSKSRVLQLAKMLSVVAIPVIALIIVCSFQLSSAIQGYNAADAAIAAFQEFLRLDKLVTGVQLERGMSAAWVSSRGTNCTRCQGVRTQTLGPRLRQYGSRMFISIRTVIRKIHIVCTYPAYFASNFYA